MSEHARKRARAVLRGRDAGTIILLPDRSWVGWYRHITLVLLALAFLTSIALAARSLSPSGLPLGERPAEAVLPPELCPLSVPEARRLLARLLFPPPSSLPLVLAWSRWRRSHQCRASFFHSRHRLKAG